MPKRTAKAKRANVLIAVNASCRSRNAYDLKVAAIEVQEGDTVEAGQLLATLEYYKIATEITAPAAGRVAKIHVKLDDEVQGRRPADRSRAPLMFGRF
ncbi:MAG: biotin/lipoyl-binding protein [Alphaproteobacteria bacterium]|nr:biotin/lipoyl-binding protein [Alphaproteobacteria bacterium]